MVTLEVSQVANYIKNLFLRESVFHNIRIVGEMSNLKISNGNIFFDIKDSEASIKCVVFKSTASKLDLSLYNNGQKITAIGNLTTYPAGSNYQLVVSDILLQGKGNLYLEFLRLKEKLEKEGLFDNSKKLALPRFYNKLGIISSENGAAIRDVFKVLKRRNSNLDIVLYPVTVQGDLAAKEVIQAIDYFEFSSDVDLILITRGGGSFEDLFCFNNEDMVRRVSACNKPIIAAIGHEVDFTLVEAASDFRAATPSEAAEILSFDANVEKNRIHNDLKRLDKAITTSLNYLSQELNFLNDKLKINNPKQKIENEIKDLQKSGEDIEKTFENLMNNKFSNLKLLLNKLENYNSSRILKLGYSLVEKEGKIICSADELSKDDHFKLNFYDSSVLARVLNKESE